MHTLDLNRGAVTLLRQLFNVQGVLTDPVSVFRAGSIGLRIDEMMETWPPQPEGDAPRAAQVDWKLPEVALELSEKERETCKSVVEQCCQKGLVPPWRESVLLLRALGLGE